MYIYIYIYMYVCMYVCMYVYKQISLLTICLSILSSLHYDMKGLRLLCLLCRLCHLCHLGSIGIFVTGVLSSQAPVVYARFSY